MALQFACAQMTDETLMESMPGCACDFDALPGGITVDDIIDQASDIVFLLTNGAVAGRCAVTVRPVRVPDVGCWPRSLFGEMSDGWHEDDAIPLPGPAPSVTLVKINGAVIPASEYAILDGYKLARRSGFWPGSQDIYEADTESGTFSVTYTAGITTPFLAQMAATEIACWMARWLVRSVDALPPGVTGAIQDGTTVIVDPNALDAEQTPWVSQLVGLYGGREAGTVWSVEIDGGWRLHTVAAPV